MNIEKVLQPNDLEEVQGQNVFKLSPTLEGELKSVSGNDVASIDSSLLLNEKNKLQGDSNYVQNKIFAFLLTYYLVQEKSTSVETVKQLIELLNETETLNKFETFLERLQNIKMSKSEIQFLLKNFQNIFETSQFYLLLNNLTKEVIISINSFAFFLNSKKIQLNFLEDLEKNKSLNALITQYKNYMLNYKCGQYEQPNDDLKQFIYLQSMLMDQLKKLQLEFITQIQLQTQDKFALSMHLNQVNYTLQQLQENLLKRNQNIQCTVNLKQCDSPQSYEQSIINFQSYYSNFQGMICLEMFNSLKDVEEIYKKSKKNNIQGKGVQIIFNMLLEEFKSVQQQKEQEQKIEDQQFKNEKEKGIFMKQLPQVVTHLFDEPYNEKKSFKEFLQYYSITNENLIEKIQEYTEQAHDVQRVPKLPKGTRDTLPHQVMIKNQVFDTVRSVYQKHGAVEIDTPVFELKETLMGKYGADNKLVFDLQDQGGELYSLRYDLTVPFARYMASTRIDNGRPDAFKRFQFGKVYRRDQPNMSKGRYREFYQCDLDITGNSDAMYADAEVISIMNEVISKLDLGEFVIKVNSRQILNSILRLSDIHEKDFKAVCSSIDKLDKQPWEEVESELINQKKVSYQSAQKIKVFIQYVGKPLELCQKLLDEKIFDKDKEGLEGVKDLQNMFNQLQALKWLQNIELNLSLARGLDYYTGMIFEIVLVGENIGSISGGGRYDNLIGMYTSTKIPAVGGSIGIERVFNLLENKYKKSIKNKEPKQNQTMVFINVVAGGSQKLEELNKTKLMMASLLWEQGIPTEYVYKTKPNPKNVLTQILNQQIPLCIFIGEAELNSNVFLIKELYKENKEGDKGTEYAQEKLVETVQKLIKEYENQL